MTTEPLTPHAVLLTVAETAQRLRLGKSTVFAMCANQELPTLRIGSRVLIPAAELDAWVVEHTRPVLVRHLHGKEDEGLHIVKSG